MSTRVLRVLPALCLAFSATPAAAGDPAPSGQTTWAVSAPYEDVRLKP